MIYNLMNKGYLEYLVLGHRKVRRKTLEAFLEKYEGYDLSDLYNPKIIEKVEA